MEEADTAPLLQGLGRLELEPIGVVRSPHRERADAPRQPPAARGVEGRIELLPGHGYEDALCDLERWTHVWVLFWFHLNQGFRPKVQPPRSHTRRGVFATRAPYRPNPIGMSVLRLRGVQGRVVEVSDLDILDGTPVLDLKPYHAWCDAIPDAGAGWLEDGPEDRGPRYRVELEPLAQAQLAWLEQAHGLRLQGGIERALSLGPEPHAYRRIKRIDGRLRLALKDWRVWFVVEGAVVRVQELASGYRPAELWGADDPALEAHRALARRFGKTGEGDSRCEGG